MLPQYAPDMDNVPSDYLSNGMGRYTRFRKPCDDLWVNGKARCRAWLVVHQHDTRDSCSVFQRQARLSAEPFSALAARSNVSAAAMRSKVEGQPRSASSFTRISAKARSPTGKIVPNRNCRHALSKTCAIGIGNGCSGFLRLPARTGLNVIPASATQ